MTKTTTKRKKQRPGYKNNYSKRQRTVFLYRSILAGILCFLLVIGIIFTVKAIRHLSASDGAAASATPEQLDSSNADTQTEPAPAEPVSVTLTFTGDCTLGTDVNFDYDTSLNAYYEANGPEYFLQNVKPIFDADDLTIVNFEGTLTTSNERCENLFAFKGDPEYTSILTSSSVEAATVANNHSHDYGEQGFTDTLHNLTNAGITTFGYDETAVVEVKGVKVGLVGIYELYDHLERTQQLKDSIAKVKAEGAQLIAVVFHWGNERETYPDSNQTTLGRLAIDQGAHVVVGHHPHVIQPVENYKGRYIAYSLANFCFGGNSYPSDMDTFIFQQTFTVTGDEVSVNDEVNLIPCSVSSVDWCNNYQPTPAEGDEAQRILERIQAPIS